MFHGDETKVKMAFHKDLVGVFIDRFGRDITIRPSKQKDWYETNIDVAVSDQFLGWVFALGKDVKLLGPNEIVKKFTDELTERYREYNS